MRKATIGLLVVVLSSIAAFGQDQPQWRVVKHVVLTNQSSSIEKTRILTPTKYGLYRLSAYISVRGDSGTNWTLQLNWIDAEGTATNQSIFATIGPYPSFAEIGSYVFVPHTRVPVSYEVNSSGTPLGAYNIAFTIEQLQ